MEPRTSQTPAIADGAPLFILQGNGSITNRGCEAILRETVGAIREEFGPCRFINAPHWPDWPGVYHAYPDIEHIIPPGRSILVNNFFNCFRPRTAHRYPRVTPSLPRAAAVLMIGGDNFSLDYVTPWDWYAAQQRAIDAGTPLVHWGASIGPFDAQPEFKTLAVEQLRRTSLIFAREIESVNYLAELGIVENVRHVADPAFLLSPTAPRTAHASLALLEAPCLGVNLSPLLGQYRSDQRRWQEQATDVVRQLLRSVDLPILLVSHCMLPVCDDYPFMYRMVEKLRVSRQRLDIVPPIYDCGELKWIIARLKAFIGARTHSTIAALSSHVPTLSIGYSLKARGINRDLFGHTEWVLPASSFGSGELVSKARELLNHADALKRSLREPIAQAQHRARQAATLLRQWLQAHAPSQSLPLKPAHC